MSSGCSDGVLQRGMTYEFITQATKDTKLTRCFVQSLSFVSS